MVLPFLGRAVVGSHHFYQRNYLYHKHYFINDMMPFIAAIMLLIVEITKIYFYCNCFAISLTAAATSSRLMYELCRPELNSSTYKAKVYVSSGKYCDKVI